MSSAISRVTGVRQSQNVAPFVATKSSSRWIAVRALRSYAEW
jgi:hypothetical protein